MRHYDSLENRFDGLKEKTIKRYKNRYSKLGKHVRTLGWGTEKQQITRFSQILRLGIVFEGRNVIDIGCGFGDLFAFFKENNIGLNSFTGWDINSDFIREAKAIYENDNNAYFYETDLVEVHSNDIEKKFDIGVMLGLINYNWKHEYNSKEYAYTLINKAFSLVNDVLVFDFLSNRTTSNYPKEDSVVYFCPEEILQFALSITSDVVVLHNYAPIPQKEGMVALFKGKEINSD